MSCPRIIWWMIKWGFRESYRYDRCPSGSEMCILITASIAATQNIIKCINRSGYKVNEISLEISGGRRGCSDGRMKKRLGVLSAGYRRRYYGYRCLPGRGPSLYRISAGRSGDQVSLPIYLLLLEQSLDVAEKIKIHHTEAAGNLWWI